MFVSYSNKLRFQRNLLAGLICLAVALLAMAVIRHILSMAKTGQQKVKDVALPPDVEQVIRGFSFKETGASSRINITGKEAVLRGRKIMVFRSNLAKATSLSDIKGLISSKKHTFTFRADTAEWDTNKNSPFNLSENIVLVVDGRPVHGVKSVDIYFDRQLVEVKAGSKKAYTF